MSFNNQIDDLLDTLSDENSDEVERLLRVYDIDDKIAVVAKRLLDVEGGGGGGGSLPDPITTPVTIAPTDAADVNLTLQALGVAADEDQIIDVVQGDGVHTIYADTGGNFLLRWATDADGGFAIRDAEGNTVFAVQKFTGTLKTGFFGIPAVPQPAAPSTLEDVIAALQTLGLVGA